MSVATVDHNAFLSALPSLLADGKRGRFALIHDSQVVELFPTFQEARLAGYDRFGIEPFLVQEVTDKPHPKFVTRMLRPCRV